MIQRHITDRIRTALLDTPVVLLTGARQTGKSHLVRSLVTKSFAPEYITLDSAPILNVAASDPAGFIEGLKLPIIIDEVQNVPALFRAIKTRVDRERKPGMFLLTGSANVLVIPKASESLAGRMEIVRMMPFSQDEAHALPPAHFVDGLLRKKLTSRGSSGTRRDLTPMLIRGGYPVPYLRMQPRRRLSWFRSYIDSLMQRDVRDLTNIEHLGQMPRLLELLAARSSTLLNADEVARSAGIATTTLRRYLTLLEAVHIVVLFQAYATNYSKRLIRAPKIYLNDPGLVAALLHLDTRSLDAQDTFFGQLLESFVGMELLKQAEWSRTPYRLYHYRTHAGAEVDFVAETGRGIVGIEVKSTANIESAHFRGLERLAEESRNRFIRGVILYTGREVVPFAKNLHAIPMSNLWTMS